MTRAMKRSDSFFTAEFNYAIHDLIMSWHFCFASSWFSLSNLSSVQISSNVCAVFGYIKNSIARIREHKDRA